MCDMKCVIFDLDGTLLYTLDDLLNATNYALEQLGFKKRTLYEVKSFVGDGVSKLIERALGSNCTYDIMRECLDIFKDYYSKNACKCTKPYDGIISALQFLRAKNIKIAVNSNKYDSAVKSLCKNYFGELISIALGESRDCPRKPCPDGVNKILEYLKSNKDQAIYVGDSLIDVQTAKNAQLPCISVSWGYCDKNILIKSNANVVNNADELVKKICCMFNV